MANKIDLEQLRIEIRHMKRHHVLYRVLREELTLVDHWKQQGRGDPVKAWRARGKGHDANA